MNTDLLIHSIVRQTMVFTAQLATAGGVRVRLASLANQVFRDLTTELRNQGLTQSVIADMFGLTLRTYHRRVAELDQSRTVEGSTVWEAVLAFLKQSEPVSAARVHQRFSLDDHDVIAGVLQDLVSSGLAYGTGRGMSAVYRVADQADFGKDDGTDREAAKDYLVWQAVYRQGPVTSAELVTTTGLAVSDCALCLERLTTQGRVRSDGAAEPRYTSERLDVSVGQEHGWEAAVFDHFQAVVSAIINKLSSAPGRSGNRDVRGGATYSLDLWRGHPLEERVLGTLSRLRGELEALRGEVDRETSRAGRVPTLRVIFYMGQDLREDERLDR